MIYDSKRALSFLDDSHFPGKPLASVDLYTIYSYFEKVCRKTCARDSPER